MRGAVRAVRRSNVLGPMSMILALQPYLDNSLRTAAAEFPMPRFRFFAMLEKLPLFVNNSAQYSTRTPLRLHKNS
ncbi:hypothetical protein ABIB87_001313 [Bradyrhizobium sp. JR18.2]|jgi:hypothetical protein